MHSKRQQPEPPHEPRHPSVDPEISVYAESDIELLAPGNKLVVVGYNHRTADLSVRSRFAIASEDLPHLTRNFKQLPGVGGCVLLTTCNRVEAYLEIRSEAEAEAAFVELLGGHDLTGRDALARTLFCRSDTAAVKHLLRVTAGLDSMVLGDAQILGQAKQAYRDACAFGTASPVMHKVFHHAFRCAKQIRTDTELDGAQSVAGAGMALLATTVGGLRGRRYLLVGVNEMTRTAGRRLVKAGAARIAVCNRTYERGRELARELAAGPATGLTTGPAAGRTARRHAELDIEAIPWQQLMDAVGQVDAVITSTGATEPLFTRDRLRAAVTGSSGSDKLIVVDLAVPPDVERATEDSPASSTPDEADILKVIDLEDVGAYQREIVGRRCQAAASGEAIVSRRAAEFADWLHNQQLGPKMKRLRQETEIALERELDRYGASLAAVERESLARFGRTLIKRFLGVCRRVDDES